MDKLGRDFLIAFRRIPALESAVSAKYRSVKIFNTGEMGITYTIRGAPLPGQAEPASWGYIALVGDAVRQGL